jgi:hypothetical protein
LPAPKWIRYNIRIGGFLRVIIRRRAGMDGRAPAGGPLPGGALPVPEDDFELDEHFA